MVELENGFRIYHAGDTAVFGDMTLIRDLFRPDLAMLPIGGHFTMDPRWRGPRHGAAELLVSNTSLPIHWGTFPRSPGRRRSWATRSRPAAAGGGDRLEARPGDLVLGPVAARRVRPVGAGRRAPPTGAWLAATAPSSRVAR